MTPLRASRLAGFWYLALAVTGMFGILGAEALFYVAGDAAATVAKIRADETLFRLSIYSNVVSQVCYVMVALAFYRLFEGVNRNQARILKALVIAAVPIAILNMVFKFGTQIASVFWGLWLLPLGILVWQSNWFPKVFGVLLLVNGGAYVVDSAIVMVIPDAHPLVAPVFSVLLSIGEIPFLLWMLIRGAREKTAAA